MRRTTSDPTDRTLRRWRRTMTVAAVAAATTAAAGLTTSTTAVATTTSGNVLTGTTASLKGDPGEWRTDHATQQAVDSPAPSAEYGSLATTTAASAPAWVLSHVGTGPSSWIQVTPADRYSGSAWTAAADATRGEQLGLFWYDAGGRELTSDRVWGQARTDATTSWTHLTVTGIAPDTAAYASLVEVIWYPGADETHYLTVPALTRTTGAPAALQPPFRTSGSTILDATGSPVVFRGVNRYGLEMSSGAPSITQDDIHRIRSWGANFVRLQLGEHYWLSGKCQHDRNYAARVKQVVDWINAEGMLALLDLQWVTTSKCGRPGLHNMPDADASTFWQQVATAYKNSPLVAFDLFNEPHDVSDAVWRNGGKVRSTVDGSRYTAAGMQQLYNAVRGTGATNLVFASGNGWAQTWPSTAPLSATNTVYAVHSYNCGDPPCPASYDPTPILSRFTGHGVPVMVTEFGWPDASEATYLTNVIDWAENQGWGWAAWAWPDGSCNTGSTWDLVATDDCGPGLAYEPSPTGVPVLSGLQRN